VSRSVLTREDVEVIWDRLQAGEAGYAIAQDFAVAQQTISAINTGRNWTEVTGLEAPASDNKHKSKLEPKDVRRIVELIDSGVRTGEIAKIFDVTPAAISQIKSGATWSHVTGRNLNA
jgi:uncharacterized protein (DUF433 family)